MIIFETIKKDWTYRLHNRLHYNSFYGTNRLCYQFLCLLYYPLKTLFLLFLSVYYYIFYVLYLILKYFFNRDQNDENYRDYDEEYNENSDEDYL